MNILRYLLIVTVVITLIVSVEAKADSNTDAALDAGRWDPHVSGFQGPGSANKLAESALAWFKNDAGWSKDKAPIAVRVKGDWRVGEKNLLGTPLTWGLPIEAAFIRHKDRKAKKDVAWVYSLTIVTRDAKKAPPWKTAWVGNNRQMRASNIKASGGSGPNILFRLLLTAALLCSGLILASPILKIPASIYDKIKPFRPVIGVATLAAGAVLLFFNLLSPLSDILPQASCIVAGLFLGFELLMKKPAKLATAEGNDLAGKADEAVRKTQEFLSKQEQRILKLEKYQIPMGIVCLVLALLHLFAGGIIFI